MCIPKAIWCTMFPVEGLAQVPMGNKYISGNVMEQAELLTSKISGWFRSGIHLKSLVLYCKLNNLISNAKVFYK